MQFAYLFIWSRAVYVTFRVISGVGLDVQENKSFRNKFQIWTSDLWRLSYAMKQMNECNLKHYVEQQFWSDLQRRPAGSFPNDRDGTGLRNIGIWFEIDMKHRNA